MPGAVGIGLLLLACAYALTLTGGREVAGLRPDEAAGLAAAGGAVLMVLNGVGNRFRSGFGEGFVALLLWCGIGAGAAWLYAHRDQARDLAFRALGEMSRASRCPGAATRW